MSVVPVVIRAEPNDLDDPVPSSNYWAYYECENDAEKFTISLVYEKYITNVYQATARFKGNLESKKEWKVNINTREMTDTTSTIQWKYIAGNHDPFWIDVSSIAINDKIAISMNDNGDDIFNVTGQTQVKAMDEWLNCWRLYNKTTKSTLFYSVTNGLLVSANPYNISDDINNWEIVEKNSDSNDDDSSPTENIIPSYSISIILYVSSVLTLYSLKRFKIK
ncbi:MAG: hypothetical protein ACTSR8_00825 [Promethearchaeota archaeon]